MQRNCLACGYEASESTAPLSPKSKPEPGNIAMCLMCGHLMSFADDLSYRELNDQEMFEVAGDKDILLLQATRARIVEEEENRKNKPPLEPVTHLYVVLSVGNDGAEGIVADMSDPNGTYPLISSRDRHAPMLVKVAKRSVNSSGTKMRLVKFARVETLEEFET